MSPECLDDIFTRLGRKQADRNEGDDGGRDGDEGGMGPPKLQLRKDRVSQGINDHSTADRCQGALPVSSFPVEAEKDRAEGGGLQSSYRKKDDPLDQFRLKNRQAP